MAESESPKSSRFGWVRVLLSVLLCVALIGGAGGASYVIFQSEPKAQSEGATRKTAALVETITVSRGTYRPALQVLGQVEPARDILLSPRVGGQIIAMEPDFVPGGLVQAGSPLLRIDPADFERTVTVRRSELLQVQAELAIEEGRQRVAQQEFDLLGEEINPENRTLVLREPQIATIRARVEAAQAALELAQLDLERTTVRAPFDAQILSRTANVGSQVSPGEPMGRLVGIEEYWVIASVPLRDLRWIELGDAPDTGAPVRLRHTTAWQPGEFRTARAARLIGAVDDMARLAQVLVIVPDPLARETDGPPVILGTIVQLQIQGRELADIIRLEREHLRQNDTVWIKADAQLEIRPVTVAFRDATHAYITQGLEEGESVVTTPLATVTNGLPLRTADDPAEPPAEGAAP